MVECRLQRWKDADPRRLELARPQLEAGRKQPLVGEPVVLRQLARLEHCLSQPIPRHHRLKRRNVGIEVKIIGLAVIFAYAFFKFSWSYRLFNYGAILLGAMPHRMSSKEDQAALDQAMGEAARMNVVAGRHFNRGQRAYFFAIAYLGWFLGPLPFIVATGGVLVVMWNRQFRSDARKLFS